MADQVTTNLMKWLAVHGPGMATPKLLHFVQSVRPLDEEDRPFAQIYTEHESEWAIGCAMMEIFNGCY